MNVQVCGISHSIHCAHDENICLKWDFHFPGFTIPFQIRLFAMFHVSPFFPIKAVPQHLNMKSEGRS